MIVKVSSKKQLEDCLTIVHNSFITVAKEFNLTKKNCPAHTAFISLEKLINQYEDGRDMFLYCKDNEYIGYFSLKKISDSSAELDNLAVLPVFRHLGAGKEMVEYAKKYALENFGVNKIAIGIIDENAVLKEWYKSLGFMNKGTKKFSHLPFTVGFMEIDF